MFQDDALLPWRTVRRNVELAAASWPGRAAPGPPRGSAGWIAEVGLTGYEKHLPDSLSGGMRQRVQLARALAGAPRAV